MRCVHSIQEKISNRRSKWCLKNGTKKKKQQNKWQRHSVENEGNEQQQQQKKMPHTKCLKREIRAKRVDIVFLSFFFFRVRCYKILFVFIFHDSFGSVAGLIFYFIFFLFIIASERKSNVFKSLTWMSHVYV